MLDKLTVYTESALFIAGYMSALFTLAQIRRDNSLVDAGWGLGFAVLSWYLHFYHSAPKTGLTALLITIWGLRLSIYIFWRNFRKGEDWRYARWRRQWGRWVIPRAFLQVFMLQGFFMWVIALPLLQRPTSACLAWYQVLGIMVWCLGFLWEAAADQQLFRFKSRQSGEGKIFREGLWKLSRHPNYFGEIVLWWGIFLYSLPFGIWWISIASPIVITWLLLRVSGVPMLEEKYQDDKEYQDYIRKTNALLPDLSKLLR